MCPSEPMSHLLRASARSLFGCAVQLHTFAEFNRADGPADSIAHGYLAGGPVALFGADVSGDEPPFRSEGMMLALLGTAAPSTLLNWFSRLCEAGRVVDDLQTRPWGASDGQVIDRNVLHVLLGVERASGASTPGRQPGVPGGSAPTRLG